MGGQQTEVVDWKGVGNTTLLIALTVLNSDHTFLIWTAACEFYNTCFIFQIKKLRLAWVTELVRDREDSK